MKVRVAGVSRTFGTFAALKSVDVEFPAGRLVALLGPSGSGKSTLLRVIAGLEVPDAGSVHFGDEDVTRRPVRSRNAGFVFQNYALFPHMTVAENIAFGLSVRGESRARQRERVGELLEAIQLPELGGRYPSELSGGQQQRVALARALAPSPSLLLLDEPFGALDARVRRELRDWLRRMHDVFPVTTIFVTHDQEEAFEVSDRVVVMSQGCIEQSGTPGELWDRPASPFVAEFLGESNVLEGTREGATFRAGSVVVPVPGLEADGPLRAFIRTTDVEVEAPAADQVTSFVVVDARRIGPRVRVSVEDRAGGVRLQADVESSRWSRSGLGSGDGVDVRVRGAQVFSV